MIGLGDITRWDVNPLLGGGVLTVNLTKVTTNATDYSLYISGNLVVSPEFAFLLSTPSNYLKDLGDFSFSASAVPETSRALNMMTGDSSLGFRRWRMARAAHG